MWVVGALGGRLWSGAHGTQERSPLTGGGSGAPFHSLDVSALFDTEQYAHDLRPTRRSSNLDSHRRCKQNLPGCPPNGYLKEE